MVAPPLPSILVDALAIDHDKPHNSLVVVEVDTFASVREVEGKCFVASQLLAFDETHARELGQKRVGWLRANHVGKWNNRLWLLRFESGRLIVHHHHLLLLHHVWRRKVHLLLLDRLCTKLILHFALV